MRSSVITTGGTLLTESALAIRKSSLVVKRVGLCVMVYENDGVMARKLLCLMQYNHRRREEAPNGLEASMVMQWTVNPPSSGTTGSIPVQPTNITIRRTTMGQWQCVLELFGY